MKYNSPYSAYEETGSSKDYYNQFKTAIPEIDKVYRVVGCGIIKQDVKILTIVDKVAIGKVIKDDNGGCSVGEMSMYNIDGFAIGWKYNEQRSGYRLQEI